jgi:tetratricopeptide (TPR) repeat protein
VEFQNHGDLPGAERELKEALVAARQISEGSSAVGYVVDAMGSYYAVIGRFNEAERYLTQSYSVWRGLLGAEDPALSRVVNRLVFLYLQTGQLAKARQLDLESWVRRVEQSDPSGPDLLRLLENLAALKVMEGRHADAETIYQRVVSLTSREEQADTVEQAIVLNDLGLAYFHMRQYAEAVRYLDRSLKIWERLRGPDDPNTALTMYALALAYQDDGHGEAAEPLLKRALAVAETSFGPRSLRTEEILSGYAGFLRAHNRKREARKMEERAKAIAGTTSLPRVVDMTQLTIRSRDR